jgi:hypothetical protein
MWTRWIFIKIKDDRVPPFNIRAAAAFFDHVFSNTFEHEVGKNEESKGLLVLRQNPGGFVSTGEE